MKNKRKAVGSLTALITALIFLGAVFFWWSWAIQPMLNQESSASQIFVIQKGEGLSSISWRLQKERLIKSSLAFKILILVNGLGNKIQAGDFRLKPTMTIQEIAMSLTHGTVDIWLTFPEGWRNEEIAQRLRANLEDFDYQEFIELADGKEGYLFPDTYMIPKDASPAAIIEIFSNNFENKFNRDVETKTTAQGLTRAQVITLASIVEREAGRDQDRPLIAGILLKRLHQDWPLQADATIQYVMGSARCLNQIECDYWEPVKKVDLEVDSPYNTYKYKGLPPSPICNPGLASIKAIAYPEESQYWFYLSDSSEIVHYAKTNEEQIANIKKYLR